MNIFDEQNSQILNPTEGSGRRSFEIVSFFKDLRSDYPDLASGDIYFRVFENDVTFGFSKINFIGSVSYTLEKYAEIKLPKNKEVVSLLNSNKFVIGKKEIKSLGEASGSFPSGSIILPLSSPEFGFIGFWMFRDKKKVNVHGSIKNDLIRALNAIQSEKVSAPKNEMATDVYQSLVYQQIVNLMNVVLHEIQTPVAVIKNNMGMIRKTGKFSKEEFVIISDMVERISSSAIKMTNYANIILTRNGSPLETSMPIGKIVNWIKTNYQSQLLDFANEQLKSLEWNLNAVSPEINDIEVICNPDILQGLYELLENAIRYANNGTTIRINVEEKQRATKNTVSFTFINSGIIPQDVIEKFKFISTTTDFMNHSSSERGIGIGLALANAVITRAGGTLQLANSIGQSQVSIVEVNLPIK